LITDKELRDKTLTCWIYAVDNSALSIEDLKTIPFSLLIKDCNITFMNHKRTAVQLAFEMAKIMQKNFGQDISINLDFVLAGAILIDVGNFWNMSALMGSSNKQSRQAGPPSF